jgi:protein phosphatase
MNVRLELGWLSRPGRHRRTNQDRLSAYVPRDPVLLVRKGAFFVVADGMRGCPGGEVASHLATQTVLRAYYANPSLDAVQSLRAAVGTADGWLCYWAAVRPDLRGMGTTLTAMAVCGGELMIAHVGDSRAYLVRGGRAWPLTRGYTRVADALARGLLTPQEAANHPSRRVLTRSLGGPSAAVDVRRVVCAPGDRLVLCSDGVSDPLEPHEIGWLAARSPRQAAQALVGTARRRGGRDDASVIVVSLGLPVWQPRPIAPPPRVAPRRHYGATARVVAMRAPAQQMLLLALGLGAAAVVMLFGMMLLAAGG